MGYGIYPVRLLVRGDHSMLHMTLAVVPPSTETVVFSIDGSFAASVSVTGKDPKVIFAISIERKKVSTSTTHNNLFLLALFGDNQHEPMTIFEGQTWCC